MKVMKFGGSSMGDGSRIRAVARIVKRHSSTEPCVVVVSAMHGVTDALAGLAKSASEGDAAAVQESLKGLRIKHEDAARDSLRSRGRLHREVDAIESRLTQLEGLLTAAMTIGEVPPRVRDRILSFGEVLSSDLLCGALLDAGVKAEGMSGGEAGIVTDENFGEASPLPDITRMKLSARLKPKLDEGVVPVVAGFTGATQHGDVTTLGRGGSDYSATVLAASLGADEVWLWSDVDGILTCDPRIVKTAKVLRRVSYAEAMEMVVFGAKNIHPRALEPVARARIPVRVRNTFKPSDEGTLIFGEPKESGGVAKCVTVMKDVGLISVNGAGMVGRPGTAAAIFDVVSSAGVNIVMISQSVSEGGLSLLVRRDALYRAVTGLELNLLGKGAVDEVLSEDDVAAVSVVGAGMRGTPGVAARVFGAVARKGVNVRMIAQGSSELSISFVVKESEADTAVAAMARAFGL